MQLPTYSSNCCLPLPQTPTPGAVFQQVRGNVCPARAQCMPGALPLYQVSDL